MQLNSPALQAKPSEFRPAPFQEFLLALLMLGWPQNSFGPKLQSSSTKRKKKTNECIAQSKELTCELRNSHINSNIIKSFLHQLFDL